MWAILGASAGACAGAMYATFLVITRRRRRLQKLRPVSPADKVRNAPSPAGPWLYQGCAHGAQHGPCKATCIDSDRH